MLSCQCELGGVEGGVSETVRSRREPVEGSSGGGPGTTPWPAGAAAPCQGGRASSPWDYLLSLAWGPRRWPKGERHEAETLEVDSVLPAGPGTPPGAMPTIAVPDQLCEIAVGMSTGGAGSSEGRRGRSFAVLAKLEAAPERAGPSLLTYDDPAPGSAELTPVVVLDMPFCLCAWRALRRGNERRDFWRWALRWRRRSRPQLMAAIATHAPAADVVVLRGPRAASVGFPSAPDPSFGRYGFAAACRLRKES